MCGIVGAVDFNNKAEIKIINAMINSIKYRGPDASGTYIGKEVFLGTARLSIIDLVTGDQPITNEDGTIVTVYNGEIYNFQELRQTLINKGHIFKTHTDTEVLVHLYEEEGFETPKFLNGMFAFAIWDAKKHQLILARDQVGIKPLYYYRSANLFVFGSELKALLNHPKVKKNLNIDVLNLYTRFGYIPGKFSIFSGIYKLLPGQCLTFNRQGVKIRTYWELGSAKMNGDDDLDHLLSQVVERQMVADVPVGLLLSGGIDSSLIALYCTKFMKKRLQTFSVTFKEQSFTEGEYAKEVAQRLGTNHRQIEFLPKDIEKLFPLIFEKLDEPIADPSLFPTFQVCRLAAKHVKVVLSGDGGDELFAGYPTYQAHLYAGLSPRLPRTLINLAKKVLSMMPIEYTNYPLSERFTIFLSGLPYSSRDRHLYWMQLLFGNAQSLLHAELRRTIDSNKFLIMPDLKIDSVKQAQLIDIQMYLPDDLLVKSDRASMFNSLEMRVPLLDMEMVSYAFSQPRDRHINLWQTKKMLRELLRLKFPDSITQRKKKGFGIPLALWMRKGLKSFITSLLENPQLDEYFTRSEIDRLWAMHLAGSANYARPLWTIVILSAWMKRWLS